jgi:hypothetical protein
MVQSECQARRTHFSEFVRYAVIAAMKRGRSGHGGIGICDSSRPRSISRNAGPSLGGGGFVVVDKLRLDHRISTARVNPFIDVH